MLMQRGPYVLLEIAWGSLYLKGDEECQSFWYLDTQSDVYGFGITCYKNFTDSIPLKWVSF